MKIKKETSLRDHLMFKNHDYFFTIVEMFQRPKEGTVPVPSLSPPLRIAIARYYCSGGHHNQVRQSGGGKIKAKPPETL